MLGLYVALIENETFTRITAQIGIPFLVGVVIGKAISWALGL